MSILTVCFLLSTTQLRTWGANKAILKMGGLATIGLVSNFKKKGVELSADEEKQYEAIDQAFSDYTKGLVTEQVLTEKFNEIKAAMTPEALKKLVDEANEDINATLTKQAILLDQLKNQGVPGANGKPQTLRAQIKSALEATDVKEKLQNFKNKQAGTQGFQFEVKAAGNMSEAATTAQNTAATAIAFPQPEFIPGINDVARNKPFIIQLLNVKPTGKESIVYTEKISPDGAPVWVAEGEAGGQIDFDIQVSNSRAKMIDGYITVSIQMLDDVDYMAAEIEKELIYQLGISIDTELLQGDGTGDSLYGIESFAPAYNLTSLETVDPNNCDAVLAAAAQIAHNNFNPDIAVMNPLDYANTKLLKGSTGYYIVNPNHEGSSWAGITVVQSNQVPLGVLMVMDSSKTNVFSYQNLMISYGWINDNFIKNLITIQASQRLHSFIKGNDVNAFVYDELANIKAAIAAV